MKTKFILAASALFAMIGLVNAQSVTVTLTDHTGLSVTPINGVSVPGLTPYPGRHSFDARTGGAFADQDARNISTTYDGTTVEYPTSGGWTQVNNGGWEPQAIEDGWIRVGADDIGGQANNVSWDQLFGDPYTTAVHNFQIRISEGDPNANDNADGFGWKYVNSDQHGTSGAMYTAGEEPNLAGSLGVGFDIWNNGDMDGGAFTSVSLHYDESLISTVDLQALDTPFALETGQPIDVAITVQIPEPSSMVIASMGLLGVLGFVRRRRK